MFPLARTVCGLAITGCVIPAGVAAAAPPADGPRLNVLFIAVDDLRPDLGCYGVAGVHTPNIDRLAQGGVVFTRAYCQQAVCSPSRTSLLTGLRPDTTRIYDLQTHFRKTVPEAVTLPEHFRKNGYHTQGLGKIFHGGLDDPQSWSVPHWEPGATVSSYGKPETKARLAQKRRELEAQGKPLADRAVEQDPKTGLALRLERRVLIRGPAWEDPDVPDNELPDGRIADKAVEVLREVRDRPFFLAVGFYKPHLPFVAPKRYYDLHPPDQIRLAPNPNAPQDVPPMALTDWGELRRYEGIPQEGPLPEAISRELVRGYRAAASYTDAQIGRVLDELERLELRDRTVVVLWGDHGWQLGEHGLWCKHTNFEVATRSPLIWRAPVRTPAGVRTDALAEFVDVYPTLCELAGLPAPEGLEGASLVPVLKDPARPVKTAAFSQYPRGRLTGYSIRTDRYRYTEWAAPGEAPAGVELYDHQTDPGENVNLAHRSEQAGVVKQLSDRLRAGWPAAKPAPLETSNRPASAPAAAPPPRPSILFAIADDWGWPHAGVYGDRCVRTPTFDRLAREGVLFTRAFCTTPSCTASRGAILTGQTPHRLAEGFNLWSTLPARFAVYPDILERSGYVVGCTRKGWGPGNVEAGGRTRNPAGPSFKNFEEFLITVPPDRPFCFWFGSQDPHRPYEKGSGLRAGLKAEAVAVPPFLPDTPEVRSDLLDYYFEVQRFDREVGDLLRLLAEAGRVENTIVVVTSDNGMPFPRAKTNLYGAGTHLPLVIRWPAGAPRGRTLDAFVSFTDFAPTFVEAAGLPVPPEMTGRSLLGLLTGRTATHRDKVFLERERHGRARVGNGGYPVRAVRTREFLYIRNVRPDRWPAGDPDFEASQGRFNDMDASPTKELLLARRGEEGIARFFALACGKRPAEELYDLAADPFELENVADKPGAAGVRQQLRAALDRWMRETADPRATSDDDPWDEYPYYGRAGAKAPASRPAR